MQTENTNSRELNGSGSNIAVFKQTSASQHRESTSNGETIQIAFKLLEQYEENVRTVKPSKQSDKQLLASIRKHGLLQNLIVFKADNGKFKVVGGGRRLGQLTILVSEKHYTENDTFNCLVTSKENAIALSLHENSGRENMHPADQFMAYKVLVDQGLSVEDVSIEFGETTAHIKKRLKLSTVAPRLIQYYRNNNLTLDAVMAFTVSDNHKDQLAAYAQLAPHDLNAYQIRRILTDQTLQSTDRLVKFVGLTNYKKAGGSTSTDMFNNNTVYVNQPDIIFDLAEKMMNKQCGKLLVAGWLWADFDIDQYFIDHEMPSLDAQLVGVPEDLEKQIAEQEQLGDADWSEDNDARDKEIDNLLEILDNKRNSYFHYTDEQKSVSGVRVYCDRDGKLQMQYGRVRPEDIDKAFPNKKKKSKQAQANKDTQDTGIESQALKNNIKNYRTQAVQSQIALKPVMANDLLTFSLAIKLLSDEYNSVSLINITSEATTFTQTGDIDDTLANEKLRRHKQALPLAWMQAESEVEQFEKFQELSNKDKQKIMAHCVAISFSGAMYGKDELQTSLENQLNFDFSSLWKPTAENYYGKLQKKHLLELGKGVLGDMFYHQNQSAKKFDIVELISKDHAFKDWMPDIA